MPSRVSSRLEPISIVHTAFDASMLSSAASYGWVLNFRAGRYIQTEYRMMSLTRWQAAYGARITFTFTFDRAQLSDAPSTRKPSGESLPRPHDKT